MTVQLKPVGNPAGMVNVMADALVDCIILPLSAADKVYEAEMEATLAPNPEMVDVLELPPVRFPVVLTLPEV